jgi:hypothetical protein
MPSIGTQLRQIPTGLQYGIGVGQGSVYDFVPTNGNYVGNYPPGYMCLPTETGLSSAITDASTNSGQLILRDMGKTIFAPYALNGTVANGNAGNFDSYGYYRQYQLLIVNPISTTQGFLGGVGGNTFGVVGPAPATVPGTSTYITVYLPVSVQGVGNSGSVALVQPIAGGQM